MTSEWRRYVRQRLPASDIAPAREIEIVDELALQLDAVYDAARERGLSDAEARALAQSEVSDWAQFARTLSRVERPIASRAPRSLRPSAGVWICTGILFGFLPALQAATGRSLTFLRGDRVTGTSAGRSTARRALLLTEVALALAAVSMLLLAVTAVAAYLPARRATRIDPASTLRGE